MDRDDEDTLPGEDELDTPEGGEAEPEGESEAEPDEGEEETPEGDNDGFDSEGEPEEEQEPEPELAPPTRKESAYARLRRERREERTRADNLQRQLDERAAAPRTDSAEQQRQRKLEREAALETARLSGPEAVAEFLQRETIQMVDQRLNQATFHTQDLADQRAFDRICARNPAIDRIADDVDAKLADMRKQGQNVSREALAYFLIGQRAVKRGGSAAETQRQAAAGRKARQTVRKTAGGRSDVGRPERRERGDSVDALEKRLGKQSI